MDLELNERAFIITGGTDGLGLALAKTLLNEGANVAVCGRNEERIAEVQQALGSGALCVKADVTNTDDLDRLVAVTLERFGRLDGVVNNAGASAGSAIADSTDDQWRSDFDLKLFSALHLSRQCLDELEKTSGSIVNVLAILARAPSKNSGPSSVSRAAGLALTKALSQEVAPRGIRVNAVLIGLIQSGQWERRAGDSNVDMDTFYKTMAKNSNIPFGRVGRAEEFGDLVSFLLSSRASYITGVGISIDGGLSPVI